MIRWSTTAVVVLLAGVAAVVSYRHAYELVIAHGESGFTAVLVPATVDGLVYASSMVLLDAARRGAARPKLAYFTLALGILATLGANVAHGWAHGVIGSIVAAWPALALVLSYELLMGIIRRSAVTTVTPEVEAVAVRDTDSSGSRQVRISRESPAGTESEKTPADLREFVPAVPVLSPAPTPVLTPAPDKLFPVAADRYAAVLAEGQVPPLTEIKSDLHVGQPRAKRIHTYLHLLAEVSR